MRLCVRFLFCVFPELHWLRQELAGVTTSGVSNPPVAPSDWSRPFRGRENQSESEGGAEAPSGPAVTLGCSLSQSRGSVHLAGLDRVGLFSSGLRVPAVQQCSLSQSRGSEAQHAAWAEPQGDGSACCARVGRGSAPWDRLSASLPRGY